MNAKPPPATLRDSSQHSTCVSATPQEKLKIGRLYIIGLRLQRMLCHFDRKTNAIHHMMINIKICLLDVRHYCHVINDHFRHVPTNSKKNCKGTKKNGDW